LEGRVEKPCFDLVTNGDRPVWVTYLGYICCGYAGLLLVAISTARFRRSWVWLGLGADALIFAAAMAVEFLQG
jgi:hypothetical protein